MELIGLTLRKRHVILLQILAIPPIRTFRETKPLLKRIVPLQPSPETGDEGISATHDRISFAAAGDGIGCGTPVIGK